MNKNNNQNKIPVIVIFAPTATGKTALTVDLFSSSSHSFFKNRAEIISADSMAVYKNMNIGTAKPSSDLTKIIAHHLIDLVTPNVQFSVNEFVKNADLVAQEIFARKKIPLVVGGTGFYIRNFLLGLPKTPASDENLRNELKEELEKCGIDFMYQKLSLVDPESSKKINKNDAYRILRALEVFYLTGKPRSEFSLPQNIRSKYDAFPIILERDRTDLYERIDFRVEKMFEDGLVSEVENLIQQGYKKDDPGMQAIGYREFFMFDDLLKKSKSEYIEKVKAQIKHDSHKYAKKQYVFMKGIPNAKTFFIPKGVDYTQEIIFAIKNFVEKIEFCE